MDDGEMDDVAATLTTTDASRLVEILCGADVPQLRNLFRSFGSCNVTEPFDDLAALSLQPGQDGEQT